MQDSRNTDRAARYRATPYVALLGPHQKNPKPPLSRALRERVTAEWRLGFDGWAYAT